MKRFVALAGSAFMFTFLLSAIGPVSRASAAYPCNPGWTFHRYYAVGNTLKGSAWAGGPCWAEWTSVKTCLQRRYYSYPQGTVWGGDVGCGSYTSPGTASASTASLANAPHNKSYRLHVNVWQYAPNGDVVGHNYFYTPAYFYK